MNEIRLKNFRCFRDEQKARLAPLTLLVGENSTGKTSFMAMVRILSDMAYRSMNPDFKEDPYDLGSFDEIAHHRGGRGGRADTFEAGFSVKSSPEGHGARSFQFTFGRSGTTPVLMRRSISHGKTWSEESFVDGEPNASLQVGTSNGIWTVRSPNHLVPRFSSNGDILRNLSLYLDLLVWANTDQTGEVEFVPTEGETPPSRKDFVRLRILTARPNQGRRPFASAPVRSKPRRTYDPSRPTPDPEGDYVPMYLADMYSRNKPTWRDLKERLEDFGKVSGLFDEISIKRLGNRDSEPFQVQIRKFGGGLKGPQRNLIDVGYGVSQVLPIITELLREDAPDLFLLQQPEVHIHPSAQAALGSLFCQVASSGRQLVIETHSDHLMNRVRLDIRDGTSPLSPDDVSILYFEREDLDVKIHPLWIDEEGNVLVPGVVSSRYCFGALHAVLDW